MNKQLSKRGIVRLWCVQSGVTLVFAALCALVYDTNAASSALLGGIVCIVPNAFFASKLFKYQGARSAKQIVNSFYKGEALKIVISIFLFTAVFLLFKITPLAFFASYIMIQMTHWFTPLIIINKQNRPESD
ncbi:MULTISPECIES: F0F1 ATP synthase subunit I [Legionella]|uniref:ATP synthase subunit I n=1 Tax=Legionella steelei TaxID=947033 RepID=A0A0W0ZK29_9GAMM|nr:MULTISPECIES: F0F1 ATP synthase subunit I [Legionella]KTD69450.1 ATP synthase subunit I [Legionella steelei]MBN9228705.1 F0F1 ATP synthase subunit I [Legionella steelei]OJW08631.1 MAG: F0F1 ATP synthase subunit I [Legionella sp. 39-23]